MKNLNALCIVLISTLAYLTSCSSSSEKIATFKVWGNCGMCKETIEASLISDGVTTANWNKNTKIIEVKYDTLVVTIDDIHKQIASAGYDTDKARGEDKAYANLHECCQYKRKE